MDPTTLLKEFFENVVEVMREVRVTREKPGIDILRVHLANDQMEAAHDVADLLITKLDEGGDEPDFRRLTLEFIAEIYEIGTPEPDEGEDDGD